jgi:hypothetical protein
MREQNTAAIRNRRGYLEYNKTVLSPAFLSQVKSEVYFEAQDSQFSTATPHVRVGSHFAPSQLVGGATASTANQLTLRQSAFTIYQDAIAVISFEFTADDMEINEFISLIARLSRVSQEAAAEKLASVLSLSANQISHLASSMSDFAQEALADPAGLLRSYGCMHLFAAAESLLDDDGRRMGFEDLVEDPAALTGILRCTAVASDYRSEELSEIADLCMGYKNDELYATLRGTSFALVPGHWDSRNFLSLYIEDLCCLVNYIVSRATLLEFTVHQTYLPQSEDLPPNAPANKLVEDILLLRRLLLLIDGSLDADLWINHYFTRELILQLEHQRGLPNKVAALKRRIDGLDGVLNVIAQSNLANRTMAATLNQLRVAVVALVISAVLAAASVGIGIAELLRPAH